MAKERLHYIDIAKGVLIIFVIIGHIRVFSSMNGIDVNAFGYLRFLDICWTGFFIQAFFFITGFCSNFDKPWRQYLDDNARTILFPIIPISFSLSFISLLLSRSTDFDVIENAFLHLNVNYWFLLALFIGKLLYWPLRNLSVIEKCSIAIFMHLLGFILWHYHFIPNIWYFLHALLLTPFLIFGDVSKNVKCKKTTTYALSGAYLLMLLFLYYFNIESTIIAWDVHLSWSNILFSIPMGLCGTLLLLCTCKMIGRIDGIEYLGRNTLPLFMVHLSFMLPFITYFHDWINQNGIIGWFSILIFTILCSSFYLLIVNTPFLRWMLGKWKR